MSQKAGGYFKFFKPILLLFDLIILCSFLSVFHLNNTKNQGLFIAYIIVLWIIISIENRFYDTTRPIKVTKILIALLRQFNIFYFILFAFIGLFKRVEISRLNLFYYFISVFIVIGFFKISSYFFLLKYRSNFGGNIRNVVVIGKNKKTKQLLDLFKTNKAFGYNIVNLFSTKKNALEDIFRYILENRVDEIYCSLAELTDSQITEIINFADNNLITVKFIPDSKRLFTKKLHIEYYEYLPILSLREIPLKNTLNKSLKRLFDVVFSLLVIVFILSWLYPIIAILIRLESKGKTLFKQERTGIDNQSFNCFKFRSMKENKEANKIQATKNDKRITKLGGYLRRSSLDELPQFFNVLMGDMSVVGPRPHMLSHNELYASKVDKYMVRLFVKPGITGLAQVKGYRGEIEEDSDIVNRVKFDIFYVENWSFVLDIKIVIQTVLNVFKGEKKAY